MSSFIERLTERRYSHNAVAAKLDRVKARKPDTQFIVVEAIADRLVFLGTTKEALRTRDIVPVLCDGKRGVLELLRYVREKYGPDPHILFFVDRDFDDYLGGNVDDNFTYVTDEYSVENSFVNAEAFRYIVEHVFCCDDTDAELDNYVQKFEASLDNFAEELLPVMAWIVGTRQNGGKLNLNNAQLSEVIDLTDVYSPKRKKKALKKFHDACSVNLSLKSPCAIRPILKSFANQEPHALIRGKYLLWFMMKFLNAFKLERSGAQIKGERSNFLNAQIDETNFFPLLVGRIATPASLAAFLQKVAEAHLPATT